ncbi:uncharacterized protein LOC116020245 [Ipomoea triloba]|uniref:uncharacterized protein LOC116020245 n=1 Tax=Ipomoea triloba TaxID=35885 RepID=UPI00125D1B96|nr:uncharacterized protein LOC116020245 [Ipomoea triloba]
MEWEINDLGSFAAAIMGMMLCWNPMMFTGAIEKGDMARLPLRQKMRLQAVVLILRIKIMESMFNMLIMDGRALAKLCDLLRTHGNLKDSRNATIDEMVISFLHIVAHNIKNRVLKRQTTRSGETISRQFHAVLNSILRLHNMLLRKPEPIQDNSVDERWKWFKGCLGALDGTFIKVNVETIDKPRYRTRKGWEGSATDSRILRDAISRMNGLKVPQGNYYLCDAGYTNGDGFLAPSEMPIDPIEIEVGQNECNTFQSEEDDEDLIKHCETSRAWTEWRDKLAHEMFTTWQAEQH